MDQCSNVTDPNPPMAEPELIASLQSQLQSLRNRVKELETENAKLLSRISNCRCNKIEGNLDSKVADRVGGSVEESAKLEAGVGNTQKKSRETLPGCNMAAMHHHSKRYVALKVMYFGQRLKQTIAIVEELLLETVEHSLPSHNDGGCNNTPRDGNKYVNILVNDVQKLEKRPLFYTPYVFRFYGFASEAQMDPTIESEIFKALEKTKLIVCDKKDLKYSRCGRTDKGVSSVGQAASQASRLTIIESFESTEVIGAEGEIDYVRILNRILPKDIRVIGWCPAPINFSARFSCLSRVYKYFFWRENLNIVAMETAGKKFVGEHDFRNFCKMDAANVHNYRRHITLFDILPCNERFEGDQLWAMKIKGSAFLWHQVRCMVAVLFMIGQGLESPNVIDALLDIDRTSRKPQYTMAPEIPLVLQSCEFEDLRFMCSSDARQALNVHLEKECRTYKLQAAIFYEALLSCSLVERDDYTLNNRMKKKLASHVPLMSRPTEPSYEERRTKLTLVAQK